MNKKSKFNLIFNNEGKELKDIVIDLILKTLKNGQHDWQIFFYAA